MSPDRITLYANVIAWLANAAAWTFVSHSLFMTAASLCAAVGFAYLARRS